jgi:hypothetical protein
VPALLPTDFTCTVVWLGNNADRATTLASAPQTSMTLTFAGYAGESHAGLTRPSDSRVIDQYPRGTEIRNTRQLSILSSEDLAAIAEAMQLEALDPALLGASMVVEGLPDFSHIPPSSRLQDLATGTTLTVDMENRPCNLPSKGIEARYPGRGKAFRAAAVGRRGVTAWVEREGDIAVGATLRLHIPDQPVWTYLSEARS